jgi:hypothetical protein
VTKRQLERRVRRIQRRNIRRWKRLSPPQRTVMVTGAVVQVTLFTAAQIDITKRDAAEIRGSKLLWRLLCLVNFIGPILYFTVGRIPSDEEVKQATEPGSSPAEPTKETPEMTPIVA